MFNFLIFINLRGDNILVNEDDFKLFQLEFEKDMKNIIISKTITLSDSQIINLFTNNLTNEIKISMENLITDFIKYLKEKKNSEKDFSWYLMFGLLMFVLELVFSLIEGFDNIFRIINSILLISSIVFFTLHKYSNYIRVSDKAFNGLFTTFAIISILIIVILPIVLNYLDFYLDEFWNLLFYNIMIVGFFCLLFLVFLPSLESNFDKTFFNIIGSIICLLIILLIHLSRYNLLTVNNS
jgi:hypothetical protein